jgi:DNA-binding transcriptional MerR regulator
LHLNVGTPSHTTVLNRTKKQGISHFRDSEFYNQEKWVLIADESIQFGNKKLLLILAVPEARCKQGKALGYGDLTPLVLQVSASWKSENIVSEIRQHIDFKQIACCISDNGSNLTCAYNSLKCKHIMDINHKFSLIIQSVFENNCLFNDYTKALSLFRTQKSVSKIARIVSPNQRVMSRFMNLTPLFEWGVKMIILLDSNQLTQEEQTALSFLKPYKAFIFDTYQILIRLNKMQKFLKNNGFNNKNAKVAMRLLSDMNSDNSLKIKKQLKDYFADLSSKTKESETICCSSDIIESCFSRYKRIVKGNKSVGISDLSLCIAAMMGENSLDKTKHSMETIKTEQLKDWRTKNVSKTLFAEKRELNKKVNEIIS